MDQAQTQTRPMPAFIWGRFSLISSALPTFCSTMQKAFRA